MPVGTTPMKFADIRDIVSEFQIQKLYRSPKVFEEYSKFKQQLVSDEVDMTTRLFVTQLHWLPETMDIHTPIAEAQKAVPYTDSRPFANASDMTIVPNLFPYYVEEGVVHLCVWLKFPFEPDPTSPIGDISPENKRLAEKYVYQTFAKGLGMSRDRVVWFKNYAALQSVKAVPHLHVVLDHPDKEKLEKMMLTGGVPIVYDADAKL